MASKDASIKQAADLAIQAHTAAEAWAEATQADVDRVTQAMADAGYEAAAYLAELAREETGYGRVDHKTFKNIFCTRLYLDQIRHVPTVGVIASDPSRGVTEIAEPVGVVAGLVPVTNPTATTLFYGIACVRARNAVVNAPSPIVEYRPGFTLARSGGLVALSVPLAFLALPWFAAWKLAPRERLAHGVLWLGGALIFALAARGLLVAETSVCAQVWIAFSQHPGSCAADAC